MFHLKKVFTDSVNNVAYGIIGSCNSIYVQVFRLYLIEIFHLPDSVMRNLGGTYPI